MGNFDKVLIDYCIFCTRTNEKCSKCTKSRIDLRRELNAVSVRELIASAIVNWRQAVVNCKPLVCVTVKFLLLQKWSCSTVKFAKQVKFAPKAQGWKNCNLSLICHSERSEESGNTNTTPTAQPTVATTGRQLLPSLWGEGVNAVDGWVVFKFSHNACVASISLAFGEYHSPQVNITFCNAKHITVAFSQPDRHPQHPRNPL